MKSEKILIIIAIVLILGAFAAIGFAIFSDFGGGEERINETETDTTAVYVHEPEEYHYNEDGTLKSITYYENNVYNGQIQYFTDKDTNTSYAITYNSKDEEIATTVEQKNVLGKTTLYRERKMGEIVLQIEYTYADDYETLTKQIAKTYKDGDEIGVKLFYDEDGVTVIRKCEYLNGELTSDESYDENNVFVPEND